MNEKNDTSGFYKNNDGSLLYAPNYVLHKSYELHHDRRESYDYPVAGWYWFDSKAEARAFFGLPPKDEEEEAGETSPHRP